MRSPSISPFISRKYCWFLLTTGAQAVPNRVNRADISSRSSRHDVRSIYPRVETIDLDHGQNIQTNASSLETKPIYPSHEKKIFLTPPIIITLVLFLMFAASLIAVFFYGHEIRSFFQKLRRRNTEEPAVEEPGFELGFDGPTEAEVEKLKWREEKETVKKPFWRRSLRLPTRRPALSPEQSLLPPVSSDDAKISLEDSKVDETHVDNEARAGTGNSNASDRCEGVSNHGVVHVVDR